MPCASLLEAVLDKNIRNTVGNLHPDINIDDVVESL